MTLDFIAPLLTGLVCAALFVLLFQKLFPRPAPWGLTALALLSGIVITAIFTLLLVRFAMPGLEALQALSSQAEALRFAILRVGLPEEATKALAALLALLPFRRRATPAQAFQCALFAAIGFAIVENSGYVAAFESYGMLVALGRGLVATFMHALLAMIFGGFLMRFVAGGWRGWHLPLLGYLAASACHALYDVGLLLPAGEFLRTGSVGVETMLAAFPVVLAGFGLLFAAGFWSLGRATRRAAAADPIAADPAHQRSVRNWRRTSGIAFSVGALALGGGVAWALMGDFITTDTDELQAYAWLGTMIGALFAILLGIVLRQKR